jgi:hemerythrin-like metal-binding protein
MANLFNFDDEFKLGIPAADIEHSSLVDMLNRTHELLAAQKRKEARTYFNQTLGDYVHEHFSNEEKFLESIQYPDLENHKKVHANFRKSFEELAPRIETADDAAFRQALTDTYVWIINHIGKTDRKYAKFYFEKQAE